MTKLIVPHIVTVSILYRMPDYEDILQQFVWQTSDVPPDLPRVHQFIDFWKSHLDAEIFSWEVSDHEGYRPVGYKFDRGPLN